jgi:phage/plasmid-associated DNA primase
MDQFRIDKSLFKNGNIESTHTTMGPIYKKRGNFNIPADKLDEFYDSYNKFVFEDSNYCYMTERPLKKKGILKFDFDILYKSENQLNERLFDQKQILFLVNIIQKEIQETLVSSSEEEFHLYLFLRPSPYCKKVERNEMNDKITYLIKDGIHIMCPNLFLDYKIHHYLRKKVLERCIECNIQELFHFENSYEDFVDESIIEKSGWLMFGSTKEGVKPYQLIGIYDKELSEVLFKNISKIDLVKILSIRKEIPEFTNINPKILEKIESNKLHFTPKRKSIENNYQQLNKRQAIQSIDVERNIVCNIPLQSKKNLATTKLVAILNPTRATNYNDWIQVGLCLHNIGNYFELWKSFSKQVFSIQELTDGEPDPDVSIEKWETILNEKQRAREIINSKYICGNESAWETYLFEVWENFKKKNEGSLQYGTLMYWAKNDNEKIFETLITSQMDKMIRESVLNPSHKKLASILFRKYQGQFICSDYEKCIWYEWSHHSWKRMDGNSTIRRKITGSCLDENSLIQDFERCKNKIVEEKLLNNPELIEKKILIEKLTSELQPKMEELIEFKTKYGHNASVPELQKTVKDLSNDLKTTKDEYDKIQREIRKLYIKPYDEVIQKMLETSTSIDNIVKEAKQEFYDENFNRKVNSNPFLFLFKNGVYDLEKNIFRNGYPEDYLSIENDNEQMEYKNFESFDVQEIQDVEKYFSKVIVDEEKRLFFLTLVASCLEGFNTNNIFPILTGSGSNAKSLTMNFIEECFGKYSGKLNPAFLTQKRNKSNSASPEYYNIVDCRIVSSEESDMTDELNTAIIKEITGNSKITSRTLFQSKMTTKTPQFIPFLICNDLPNIKSMDGGTWRRIVVISFDSKFVDDPTDKQYSHLSNVFQIDRSLKKKMSSWVQPFMFLLINKYYQIYVANGKNLVPPKSVRATTDKYKDENDILQAFIDIFIETTGNKTDCIKLKDLYNCLLIWFRDNFQGEKEPSMQTVKKYFETKFGNYDARGWIGKKLIV